MESAAGELLGFGAWSARSQIKLRMWTFGEAGAPDEALLRQRLKASLDRRGHLISDSPEGACRLVFSESDRIPGLVVDRYGSYLVCQFLSAGVERVKSSVVSLLAELCPCSGIFERSDTASRRLEGLPRSTGVLFGESPPDWVEIEEAGLVYTVDVAGGHKTGFYLDQRHNRVLAREYAGGTEMLNCFAYTGAFATAALAGGARHVLNVESSAAAVSVIPKTAVQNGLDVDRLEILKDDVFKVLRALDKEDRRFDFIVLDPPKLAESRDHVARAARGYKDLNLYAMKLLRSGGLLMTFSCSGHIKQDLFQKIVADAALDAGRDARVVRRLHQPEDHPVLLSFPESDYLKGLLLRVAD